MTMLLRMITVRCCSYSDLTLLFVLRFRSASVLLLLCC